MKHVPFCEYNPFEATKTNVIGTENMVNASLTNNVSRFLLVSTDKVVSPTSCLGATKLLAERVVMNSENIKGYKKTLFACARFECDQYKRFNSSILHITNRKQSKFNCN